MLSPVIFVFAAGGVLRLHRGDVDQVKKWTLGIQLCSEIVYLVGLKPNFLCLSINTEIAVHLKASVGYAQKLIHRSTVGAAV
jgi:hypothetical protein